MKHIVHKRRRPVWPHILRFEIEDLFLGLSTEEVKYISGDWILENKKTTKQSRNTNIMYIGLRVSMKSMGEHNRNI